MDIAVLVIKIIISLTFTIGGAGKLFKIPNITPAVAESFERFGLNKPMMQLGGAGELLGVALLWIPLFDDSDRFGAALLSLIAILAAGFHIKFKDKIDELMPAIVMAALAGFVAIFT